MRLRMRSQAKKNKKTKAFFRLSFTSNFLYWFIPVVFLMTAIFVLFLFKVNFKFKDNLITKQVPAKIIDVAEPFSGELYFNNDFAGTELSKVIISSIDQAKVKIELAVYSMDHGLIRDALYKASQRGVKITLLLSQKQVEGHDKIFQDLPTGFERLDAKAIKSGDSLNGLMHNKFLIIDRGTPNQKLLFGSYNFTELQEKYDPSFIMETSRAEIVTVFGAEFERLAKGAKGEKMKNILYNPFAALINYPEGYLEVWFSPQSEQSDLKVRLLSLINSTNSQLDVLIWNLTDKEIADALAQQAFNKKSIKILTDDVNFFSADSAFVNIMSNKKITSLDNLKILTDAKRNKEIKEVFGEDFNSFLHHHLLLVDNKIAFFGTNNWSTAGFYRNNESAMVSNIPKIFKSFQTTFQINYDKAK